MNFYFCYSFPPTDHCSLFISLKSTAPVTHMAETTSVSGSLLGHLGRAASSTAQQCPLVDSYNLLVESMCSEHVAVRQLQIPIL